jgi:hypothetical protein
VKLGPEHLPAPSRQHDTGACADLTARLLAQAGAVEVDGTPAPVETFPRGSNTSANAPATALLPTVETAVEGPSTALQPRATPAPTTAAQPPGPAAANAEDWLSEALNDGPRPGAELKAAAAAAGIRERTLYRAAQRLCVLRDRGTGNRALWRLPESEPEPDGSADELPDEGTATAATTSPQGSPSAPQEPRIGVASNPATKESPEPGGDRAALLDALSALELAGEALSRAARMVRHHLPSADGAEP